MYLLLDENKRIINVTETLEIVNENWYRVDATTLLQCNFVYDVVEVSEVGQGDYYYNGQFQLLPYQEVEINTELPDAYEAIANLYEMNLSLQGRLEALENGI